MYIAISNYGGWAKAQTPAQALELAYTNGERNMAARITVWRCRKDATVQMNGGTPEAVGLIKGALPHVYWRFAGVWVEREPSKEQVEALRAFAGKYGKTWKKNLVMAWINGQDQREPNSHLLRQVRNQFGPNWLEGFDG